MLVAEGAGDDEPVEVRRAEAGRREEEPHPGLDRGRGELDLPDVLLGQGQSPGEGDRFRTDQRYGRPASISPFLRARAMRSIRPVPQTPRGEAPAIVRTAMLPVPELGLVDRAREGEHPAADRHPFERRTGRRRGGEEVRPGLEDDLAVRSQVDEEMVSAPMLDVDRGQSGGDVAADEAPDGGITTRPRGWSAGRIRRRRGGRDEKSPGRASTARVATGRPRARWFMAVLPAITVS